jgi:hypothetical protein
MAPPPSDPDWMQALRRPVPGLRLQEESAAQRFLPPVCTRCRRPANALESWLERRRLRRPDPRAPGGFAYSFHIREHRLCGPCFLEVKGGRPPSRNHGMKIMAVAAAAAVALAAALPLAMPNLLAAFWQNGALPYGWHAGHHEGRSVFIQGRY